MNLETILHNLKLNKYSRISFLLSAGISTNACIPDFRSKQGQYMKIKDKFNISDPQMFFHLKYFKENTEIFYDYLKLTDFDQYMPTKTHFFIKLLQDKNLLNIVYTQNIDSLEERAGVDRNKIVYAHGNINEAMCSYCRKQHCVVKLREHIKIGEIMYCDICCMPCKYSVVLFGEPLPEKYYNNQVLLFESDLVFIIGTSLLVKPFAYLVNSFPKSVPKILINTDNLLEREEIIKLINSKDSFVNIVGECDSAIESISEHMGLKEDLYKLLKM